MITFVSISSSSVHFLLLFSAIVKHFCNEKKWFCTSWALKNTLDLQIFAGTILTFQ